MAFTSILVRRKGRADPQSTQHTGGGTDRSELVEAVQRPGADRPRARVASENLDVQVATVRIAESRAQLGVVGRRTVPDAERQRLLHPPESRAMSACSPVRRTRWAPTGRPATRQAASAAPTSTRSTSIRWDSTRRGRWTCGAGCDGRSKSARRLRCRVERGAPGNAAEQPGGTRAGLHAVARHPVAAENCPRQPQDCAAEPAAYAAACGRRRRPRT